MAQGRVRGEKGWPVKYWLHRFQPLLPRVKHGDIWRQIDQAARAVSTVRFTRTDYIRGLRKILYGVVIR